MKPVAFSSVVKNFKMWVAFTVIFAVGVALIVVFTIRSYVQVVKVAAVSKDIQADQIITADDVTIANVAKGNMYPNAVVPQQVIGRPAKGFIPAGTILSQPMIGEGPVTIAGKLAQLGSHYGAFAVTNSLQTSVANAIRTGDRVNIYMVPSGPAEQKISKQFLASNVLVLQGLKDLQDKQGQNNQSSSQAQQGIIVALTYEDAQKILPFLSSDKMGRLVFELLPKSK